MSAKVRLAGFLAALCSAVVCAALLILGAKAGWLMPTVGIVCGLVAVGMSIARPYVFRNR